VGNARKTLPFINFFLGGEEVEESLPPDTHSQMKPSAQKFVSGQPLRELWLKASSMAPLYTQGYTVDLMLREILLWTSNQNLSWK